MSTTIFDVARRAGVSIGTVSRVLNNRDRVHPQTRARILKAIEELDYRANPLARRLAIQQTNTLGLVIPQVNDSFYFPIVRGVEIAATSAGYSLLIASQPRHIEEHRYLSLFDRGYVDAMVLVAIDVRVDEVHQIVERGVPVILVQQDIDKHIPTFVVDNYLGGYHLTQHLIQHGYKKLAYICGTNYTPDSKERLRGMSDAMAEVGLRLPRHRIVAGDYLPKSGYHATQKLLQASELPDAIFAANDQMAVDAMVALQEHGIRIPQDIAVVGFDDVPFAAYVTPKLTTVHQPVYELGWQAAQLALSMLKSEPSNQQYTAPHTLLPPSLIIRNSCGCSS